MPPKGVMKGPGDLPYSHAHAMRDDYAAFVFQAVKGWENVNSSSGRGSSIDIDN